MWGAYGTPNAIPFPAFHPPLGHIRSISMPIPVLMRSAEFNRFVEASRPDLLKCDQAECCRNGPTGCVRDPTPPVLCRIELDVFVDGLELPSPPPIRLPAARSNKPINGVLQSLRGGANRHQGQHRKCGRPASFRVVAAKCGPASAVVLQRPESTRGPVMIERGMMAQRQNRKGGCFNRILCALETPRSCRQLTRGECGVQGVESLLAIHGAFEPISGSPMIPAAAGLA